DRVPLGTEDIELLAVRLTLPCVLDERVERVMVVGDLQTTVCALCRSEQGRLCSGCCERLAGGDQRRPEAGAFPAAGTLARLVLPEEVEGAGAAAPVDENPPQRCARDGDLGTGV